MTIWVISSLLALAVAAPLAVALLRRSGPAQAAADFDIAVYRDQLRDVDRDLDRGVIALDAAERTRLEISRRILEADRQRGAATATNAPKGLGIAMTAVTMAVVIGGSLWTYDHLGAPGYGDLPLNRRIEMADTLRDTRPGQAVAEAEAPLVPPADVPQDYLDLVQKLRDTVAERPDDLRGLQLLAQNEANLGNYKAAYAAQQALLQRAGETAPAQAYSELAEFMIMAAGGYVSPEAETALREALKRDPQHAPARYYVGLMMLQTGRPDLTFRAWRPLLEQSAPDAPWVGAIRAQIEEVAARAGVRYSLPPAGAPMLSGPSAADVDAAQSLSAEDRQAMIANMVEGLAERLATEGGPAAEWARLITALTVLGQTDRAAAIYSEAQGVFAQDPDGLTLIEAAAAQAGLE